MKKFDRMSTMSGTVAEVDPQNRRLTLKGLVMNKMFEVAEDAEFVSHAKPDATLSDLRVGDEIVVSYEQHDLTAIAHGVHVGGTERLRKAA